MRMRVELEALRNGGRGAAAEVADGAADRVGNAPRPSHPLRDRAAQILRQRGPSRRRPLVSSRMNAIALDAIEQRAAVEHRAPASAAAAAGWAIRRAIGEGACRAPRPDRLEVIGHPAETAFARARRRARRQRRRSASAAAAICGGESRARGAEPARARKRAVHQHEVVDARVQASTAARPSGRRRRDAPAPSKRTITF
jgi:hypothetical protein